MEDNEKSIGRNQRRLVNTKYIKKYFDFVDDLKDSTMITHNGQTLNFGDCVEISDNHDKYGGQKGKICIGFHKDDSENMVCVEIDSKKKFIDKYYIKKITN